MEKRKITLDKAAKELYSQLEGMEDRLPPRLPFVSDGMSAGCDEAQRRFRALRGHLAELVYRTGTCLDPFRPDPKRDDRRLSYGRLQILLDEIFRFDKRHESILIRYRGGCGCSKDTENLDYEIVCRDNLLDMEWVRNLARREGFDGTKLQNQLTRAFEIFSAHGMSVFLMRIPHGEKAYRRFWVSLQICHCFLRARRQNSPVTYKIGQRRFSYPIIKNDRDKEDITIENDRISTPEKQTFIERVHHKLLNLLTFYKNRSVAKKKMTDMLYQVIDFDHQDYETIARDFNVDMEDAMRLITLLGRCFDETGNFRKSAFVNPIPTSGA